MSLEETEARDQAKIDRIRGACKNRNLQDLKNLAISKGGFISDELRREACTCRTSACGTGDCWLRVM